MSVAEGGHRQQDDRALKRPGHDVQAPFSTFAGMVAPVMESDEDGGGHPQHNQELERQEQPGPATIMMKAAKWLVSIPPRRRSTSVVMRSAS